MEHSEIEAHGADGQGTKLMHEEQRALRETGSEHLSAVGTRMQHTGETLRIKNAAGDAFFDKPPVRQVMYRLAEVMSAAGIGGLSVMAMLESSTGRGIGGGLAGAAIAALLTAGLELCRKEEAAEAAK